MFYVHGGYIVLMLYMTRVGFGIAYSVTKGQCEGLIERDKQSGRFPRFFFIYPIN